MTKADRIWEKLNSTDVAEFSATGEYCWCIPKKNFKQALPIIEAQLLPKPCVWRQHKDLKNLYKIACTNEWDALSGSFCPYCGGKITKPPKGEG